MSYNPIHPYDHNSQDVSLPLCHLCTADADTVLAHTYLSSILKILAAFITFYQLIHIEDCKMRHSLNYHIGNILHQDRRIMKNLRKNVPLTTEISETHL